MIIKDIKFYNICSPIFDSCLLLIVIWKMILIVLIIFILVWYNRVLRKNNYNFMEQL